MLRNHHIELTQIFLTKGIDVTSPRTTKQYRTKRAGQIAMAVMAFAIGALSAVQGHAQTNIVIATGSPTSVYHQIGTDLCAFINKKEKNHGIHCTAQTSKGSIDNAKKLREGAVQFAIVQSDVQFYSFKGYGPFKGIGPDPKIQSVFSLHQEPFTVVARKDAKIRSFGHLKGKRVDMGKLGSGQRTSMQLLMRINGWTKNDFAKITGLSPRLQSTAICANEIDAIMIMTGHPDADLKKTMATCPVILVHVTGAATDRLMKLLPYYQPMSIAGGTYPGSTLSTRTFGVNATLVTSSDTSDHVVKELMQAFFNNFTNFKFSHAAFAKLAPKDMAHIGLTAPKHPSAQLYFERAANLAKVMETPTPSAQ